MDKQFYKKLTTASAFLIIFLLGVLWYQDTVIDKYKNNTSIDTTVTVAVDTIFLEKTYTDSVPKYITQTIFKTDTVYRKEGDSISATPMLITLKKKSTPIVY